MENNLQTKQANQLVFIGLLLFLIGLMIGFFVPYMTNSRMALSAHLEGVMNGMFLMILGLIWGRLALSPTLLTITFWLAVYGTFANITAVLLAAITGFGKMMPIAGGKEGAGIAESIISFLLVSLGLCMVTVCIIILSGFYKHMNQTGNR
ncbi:MAG TPA: hypothetical protein PK239_03595 [Chitinophagales bacterium]|nr:hypothetical protein [Chitinophagales bacterium]